MPWLHGIAHRDAYDVVDVVNIVVYIVVIDDALVDILLSMLLLFRPTEWVKKGLLERLLPLEI